MSQLDQNATKKHPDVICLKKRDSHHLPSLTITNRSWPTTKIQEENLWSNSFKKIQDAASSNPFKTSFTETNQSNYSGNQLTGFYLSRKLVLILSWLRSLS